MFDFTKFLNNPQEIQNILFGYRLGYRVTNIKGYVIFPKILYTKAERRYKKILFN